MRISLPIKEREGCPDNIWRASEWFRAEALAYQHPPRNRERNITPISTWSIMSRFNLSQHMGVK